MPKRINIEIDDIIEGHFIDDDLSNIEKDELKSDYYKILISLQ